MGDVLHKVDVDLRMPVEMSWHNQYPKEYHDIQLMNAACYEQPLQPVVQIVIVKKTNHQVNLYEKSQRRLLPL